LTEKSRLKISGTHHYVEDPDVSGTLDVWVRLLAEALRKGPGPEPDDQPKASRRKRHPA
jgi:hypothetical protein